MSYLLSLTQDERDALLATIVYVDEPHLLEGFEHVNISKPLINYSFIYEKLKKKYPNLLNPQKLRSGDCVQNGSYRGVGKYYAIWLRKGLISHDEKFLKYFASELKEGESANDEGEGKFIRHKKLKKAKKSASFDFPTFVRRNADGPHNDGQHDVYLSCHPDEMGYAPSAALSSLPANDYFSHLDEWTMNTFDPLLTHSKSHYGKVIAEAKKSEQYVHDEDFPLQYIGNFDSEMGEEEELEFQPMDEATDPESGLFPRNYIVGLRDLFNRHFDPTAPMAEMLEDDEENDGDDANANEGEEGENDEEEEGDEE